MRILVLGSGKAGHEANALGVAEALQGDVDFRRVSPRGLFAALAPYGPVDPRDAPGRESGALSGPAPAIAIGCGRVTAPYLAALKRAYGRRTFTVFLQDPRARRAAMDLIWAPEHDGVTGANVFKTLTSPHPMTPERLAAARASPDARLADLPHPRAGFVLGGPSAAARYDHADYVRLRAAAEAISGQGFSVMVTPSRRSRPDMVAAVRAGLTGSPHFIWDGTGKNPYVAILALSDALLITGDSANMVGEAVATGAPVHVFTPQSGVGKIEAMISGLAAKGAVRRWAGILESFDYAPIDASGEIADEICKKAGLQQVAGIKSGVKR